MQISIAHCFCVWILIFMWHAGKSTHLQVVKVEKHCSHHSFHSAELNCSVPKLCLTLHDPTIACQLYPLLSQFAPFMFRWHYLTSSPSIIPFSFCFQSFPTSGSFLFSFGDHCIWSSSSGVELDPFFKLIENYLTWDWVSPYLSPSCFCYCTVWNH